MLHKEGSIHYLALEPLKEAIENGAPYDELLMLMLHNVNEQPEVAPADILYEMGVLALRRSQLGVLKSCLTMGLDMAMVPDPELHDASLAQVIKDKVRNKFAQLLVQSDNPQPFGGCADIPSQTFPEMDLMLAHGWNLGKRAPGEGGDETTKAAEPAGATLLQSACATGNTAFARYLLQHGVDPDCIGSAFGVHAVELAVVSKTAMDAADTSDGALGFRYYTGLLELLLEHGAMARGTSALSLAAHHGNHEAMRLLLAAPSGYAEFGEVVMDEDDEEDVAMVLLQDKKTFDAKRKVKKTEAKKEKATKERGAEADEPEADDDDDEFKEPKSPAAAAGESPMQIQGWFSTLLIGGHTQAYAQAYAPESREFELGRALFHCAARGELRMCRRLLANGADTDHAWDGLTVAAVARENGHERVARLVEDVEEGRIEAESKRHGRWGGGGGS